MKKIDSIDYFYKRGKPIVNKTKTIWSVSKQKNIKITYQEEGVRLEGIEYSIYSFRTGKFYKRTFHKFTNIEKLEEHIKRQILCR